MSNDTFAKANTLRDSYVVCYNKLCGESGNIKKNTIKCNKCKSYTKSLDLDTLNVYFCMDARICDNEKCALLHANKKHQSPPYVSPCHRGKSCKKENCLYLHPNKVGNSWCVV